MSNFWVLEILTEPKIANLTVARQYGRFYFTLSSRNKTQAILTATNLFAMR